MKRQLGFIGDFTQALISGKVDQEALARGKFDDVTRTPLGKRGVPYAG